MSKRHETELREFADEAAKLAQKIHQEWGSGAPAGGFQTRVNVDLPTHGPDHALKNIENLLGVLGDAIASYIRSASISE